MGVLLVVFPFLIRAQDFCHVYPIEGSRYHEVLPNLILKSCASITPSNQGLLDQQLEFTDNSGTKYALQISVHTDRRTIHAVPTFPLPGDGAFQLSYKGQVLTHFFTGKAKKPTPSVEEVFFKNDTLPGDFPLVDIIDLGSPGDGNYYLTETNNGYPYFIVDQEESVLYFQESSKAFANFQYLGDDQYGVFNIFDAIWYFLDTTFTIIDSAACTNGLLTDFHDVQITPEGNRLLMNYNNQ
ncbi:MAG: hypothetical protein AAF598_17920 [Bacteroidota bacterium]